MDASHDRSSMNKERQKIKALQLIKQQSENEKCNSPDTISWCRLLIKYGTPQKLLERQFTPLVWHRVSNCNNNSGVHYDCMKRLW
ncbi:hypothetical protein DPMN_046650 [Dreissena polymorpha]|uniref:Uncharacterized protein n=1 Tax=Dreissena polymorpha TaxID=45954 RepID=A0A9D4I0T0_DREPO|nr:hypothetical protein DPMN_046650 [Dreissena polymorpha]